MSEASYQYSYILCSLPDRLSQASGSDMIRARTRFRTNTATLHSTAWMLVWGGLILSVDQDMFDRIHSDFNDKFARIFSSLVIE